MSVTFVFAILFLLVSLGAVIFGSLTDIRDAKMSGYATAVGFFVLSALFLLFASVKMVPTKDIGIVTSFGKPVGSLSNGIHFTAPWQRVVTMDGAIQTDSHTKDGNNCVATRIARQAVACTDVSIRWRIDKNQADALFQNYREFGHIRDSLVTRDLNAALNSVFEGYDPLAVDLNGNSQSASLTSLQDKVADTMRTTIGGQVEILSVIIPVVHFDSDTQGRVNALQAQIAQTRIALQAEKTAQAQAASNRALAASLSHDPNVLVSKCFDLENEMLNKGVGVPVGHYCWPGGLPNNLIVSSTPGK